MIFQIMLLKNQLYYFHNGAYQNIIHAQAPFQHTKFYFLTMHLLEQ